ncbi:hypothetical protein ACX93W_21740 [Paenibacillus sp. CAU 1782]
MESEILVGIISLGVAVVTVVSNSIISIVSKRYDYKSSILQITLDSAYKEYEFRANGELQRAKEENRVPHVLSSTEYLIFYSNIAKLLSKKKITETDIIETLKTNKEAIDAYYKNKDGFKPEYHKRES